MIQVWNASVAEPDNTYREVDRNLLSAPRVRATSNFLSSLTAHGMATRIGIESNPSEALWYRHVIRNKKMRLAS
jgi:hypothetical protein